MNNRLHSVLVVCTSCVEIRLNVGGRRLKTLPNHVRLGEELANGGRENAEGRERGMDDSPSVPVGETISSACFLLSMGVPHPEGSMMCTRFQLTPMANPFSFLTKGFSILTGSSYIGQFYVGVAFLRLLRIYSTCFNLPHHAP